MVLSIKRLLNSIYRLLVITSSNKTKNIFNRRQLERCFGEGGLQNPAQYEQKNEILATRKLTEMDFILFPCYTKTW